MSEAGVRTWKGGRLLVVLAITLGVLLLAGRFLSTFFVEVLWFDTVGYSSVFWTRTLWQWGVRLVAGLAVACLVYLNLRIVAATLGSIQIKRRFGNLEISEQLPRSYVMWGILGTAALLGLWFAALVPGSAGIRLLLFFQGPVWGQVDPILQKDLSYYAFVLPVLGAAVTMVLVLLFLVLALSAAGYAATGALRWEEGRVGLSDVPRIHLAGIVAAFLLLLAFRFWLSRDLLLLDGGSEVQGIFGYADDHARMPAMTILAAVTVAAAGAVAWSALRTRLIPGVAGVVAVVLTALVGGQLVPSLNQRFTVEPNELARESRYIEHNMAFTRAGFGLTDIERRPFEYTPPDDVDWEAAARQFSGLPVWNRSTLLTTYQELEARFQYYEFANVGIDRYPAAAGMEPIALSVREVDPQGIPDPNWQNLHLRERYITGRGAVASAVARRTSEGRAPVILSGIPPEFHEAEWAPPELRLDQPTVYFGARPQLYAVVNPSDTAYLAPDATRGEPGVDFPRGILLSSGLRLVALAWRFREANLLFAGEVTDSSRFVFRRSVAERVRTIAPFFHYLEPPYPVVVDGRVVWMMEGFTATRWFPLSSPRTVQGAGSVSYLRNSVKATVDAVTGEVRFYAVTDDDPLLEAYRAAFPDLVRPLDEMPSPLREHLRYPESLLNVQAQLLFQYHQETPAMFHGQQDVWETAQEQAEGTGTVSYQPAYGYYRVPGRDEPSFVLTTVFVPQGRPNLTGILVAHCDPERYGQLELFDVPVADQVPGPRNVEVLVEQDPVISQQFSLWRQSGSQVWSGHLHLVPVGSTLLYMEPIFLAAEADAIPELRRFVVSDGRRVAMEETLEETIAALAGGAAGGAAAEGTPRPTAAEAPARETSPRERWPADALQLLRTAEDALRNGDWQGFGEALDRLESLLERAARPDTTSG